MSDGLKEIIWDGVASSFGNIGLIALFLIATIVAGACVAVMLFYLSWWLKFLAVIPFGIWGYFCTDRNLTEVAIVAIIIAILLLLVIPAVQ